MFRRFVLFLSRRWGQKVRPVQRPRERFRPRLEVLEDRLAPAVFTVTSTADPSTLTPGTLRDAIAQVNQSADLNNTILLPAGTYALSQGELQINPGKALNLTIQGAGPGATIVDAQGNSRVFEIDGNNSGVHVTFQDMQIKGGMVSGSNVGGGIFLNDNSVPANVDGVVLADVLLQNNQATGSNGGGGGVYATSGSVMLLGSIVQNNVAGSAGGGVYALSGDLTIMSSLLSGNVAGGSGGGVYNAAGGAITVTGSTLSGNSATVGDGGGIFATGSLTISNSTFSGNTANLGDGGGIYATGSVSISNSTLSGNTANLGGGVRANGSLSISNSTFSGNSASTGGGIYATGPSVTISGSILSGNSATNNGGALFNNGATQVSILGSAFTNNTASQGGAIDDEAASQLTIQNSSLSGNKATGTTGGALYLNGGGTYQLTNVVLNNDAASGSGGNGGAIYVAKASSLTLDTCQVQNDTASMSGGGIYNNPSTADVLVISNSIFTNDLAQAGSGGAVADLNSSSLLVSGSILSGNVAGGSSGGGGGLFTASANVTILGSAFNNDAANGSTLSSGGGLMYNPSSGGVLTVTNSQFQGDAAQGSGGAIEVSASSSTVTLSNVLLQNNTAAAFGGGLIFSDPSGTLVVDHSRILNNTATTIQGGGIWSNALNMTVEYSEVDSNKAAGGGGLYLTSSASNPNWTVKYSTLAFNQATGTSDGGGIFAQSSNSTNPGTLLILNSTIAGNTAGGNGAGLAIEGANNKLAVELLFATLDSNLATGSSSQGGGIYNAQTGKAVQLGNSLIALNSASSNANGPDLFGAFADLVLGSNDTIGHNLVGVNSGFTGLTNGSNGDQLGVSNPGLNPIANNGGPTLTNSLQAGSPALNAALIDADVTNLTTQDQRGVTRPQPSGTNGDIGAFESNLG